MKTKNIAYEDSTALLGSPLELRAKADIDGFLFFKKLLPPTPLLDLRREILLILERRGLIEPGTPLMEAWVVLEKIEKLEPFEGCCLEVYQDIQRLESFHQLAHHPKLLRIYQSIFETPVFPHPRNIARVMFPGANARVTPPHQDFIHIQGTEETWTAWFPLGDCPVELGGLSMLKGSHKEGVVAVTAAEGAGGLESVLCENDYQWLIHDFEIGDVITFPSTTIHQSLPNQRGNVTRLSCDFRYQSVNQPIEGKSLLPHTCGLTWDDIYEGWKNKNLQYYWKDEKLQMSAWDESIRWQKERICD